MTFPHCHQLYGGFIKYRLGVILVLTYLKAHSVGSVCGGCGQEPGGDARLDMTRQGEENITNDDLDEGKLGWPQLRKERKKIVLFTHKQHFSHFQISICFTKKKKITTQLMNVS